MADIRLNRNQIRAELAGAATGVVYRDLVTRAQRVTNRAKTLAPVDNGRLKASIRWEIHQAADGTPYAKVGSDLTYALYVHEGTGIYGPRRRPIRPVRARFLRFRPRGSSTYVYARSVRGVRKRPFLTDALAEAVR